MPIRLPSLPHAPPLRALRARVAKSKERRQCNEKEDCPQARLSDEAPAFALARTEIEVMTQAETEASCGQFARRCIALAGRGSSGRCTDRLQKRRVRISLAPPAAKPCILRANSLAL